MSYTWPQERYDAKPPKVKDTRALLQDWFNAIESGTVSQRFPSPTYEPEITQGMADAVMEALDEEFNRELKGWAHGVDGGYDAGPEFSRLKGTPQAIALCQDIRDVMEKHGREARLGQPGTPPGYSSGAYWAADIG